MSRTPELSVNIRPLGPDQATIDRASRRLLEQPQVREYLNRTRHRLLSFDLIAPEDVRGVKYRGRPPRPRHYRATIYDYTNNRTIVATGRLDSPRRVEVAEFARQPLPSAEEFEAAVRLVRRDREIAAAIRRGDLVPYRAMPPLALTELPDGRVERAVTVGLLPRGRTGRHEIVAANLLRRAVTRFPGGAPPTSLASRRTCNPPPNAGQATASKGTAGQVNVTVRQGSTVLWTFRAIRPAASSGTNGSGIELRYVNYRGKRVLYRAHVPILNVKYDNDSCGPYRDWQYQEGMIQANGTDVAPGFRLCPTPAQTILDTGSDTGNYLGTAIYVAGQEVVLVNEMQAGWYRYVSEWRLHANGTIRPRFGFDAVASSCTCNRHHHHVYWRLDFDIRTAGNNLVREYNKPPLFGSSNWHDKNYEIRRSRSPARKRRWRVLNKSTGEGYTIIPGANDGVASASPDWPFGRGDVWILRYRGSEIDDGVVAIGPPYEAGLDSWVNGEHVNGRDVVIWYGAHFTHDAGDEGVSHIVGPDLKPYRW